jgi:hypothetical protein
MNRRIALLTSALALFLAAGASAQMAQEGLTGSGMVRAYDPSTGIVYFMDGSSVKLDRSSVVFLENRPVAIETVRPGQLVVVQSRPAVVTPAPATVVVPAPAPVVTAPPAVIVTPQPAPTVVVPQPPAVAGTTVVAPDPRLSGVPTFKGTVARVDPGGVVYLTDGRAVRVASNSVVMADGRVVNVASLQPGTVVMVEPTVAYPSAMVAPGVVIDATRVLIQRGPEEP